MLKKASPMLITDMLIPSAGNRSEHPARRFFLMPAVHSTNETAAKTNETIKTAKRTSENKYQRLKPKDKMLKILELYLVH